jgi:hypothetical protein
MPHDLTSKTALPVQPLNISEDGQALIRWALITKFRQQRRHADEAESPIP